MEQSWGDIKAVREMFGLSTHQTKNLVRARFVRSFKCGKSRQGYVRYCLTDIEAYLAAMSIGDQPKRYFPVQGENTDV